MTRRDGRPCRGPPCTRRSSTRGTSRPSWRRAAGPSTAAASTAIFTLATNASDSGLEAELLVRDPHLELPERLRRDRATASRRGPSIRASAGSPSSPCGPLRAAARRPVPRRPRAAPPRRARRRPASRRGPRLERGAREHVDAGLARRDLDAVRLLRVHALQPHADPVRRARRVEEPLERDRSRRSS